MDITEVWCVPRAFLYLFSFHLCSVYALIENSGYHCRMRHSMKMNREVHGKPKTVHPPFEFQIIDKDGHFVKYYEPGEVYTLRLVGYIHYRGLLLQPRLCTENGYLIGSLKCGRFLESPTWEHYGIRMQTCNLKNPTYDSVTHSNDARKFLVQLEWTTDKDVGPVQFILTIAEEDDIYWERWRPRSGFLLPSRYRGRKIDIPDEIFADNLSLPQKSRQ